MEKESVKHVRSMPEIVVPPPVNPAARVQLCLFDQPLCDSGLFQLQRLLTALTAAQTSMSSSSSLLLHCGRNREAAAHDY